MLFSRKKEAPDNVGITTSPGMTLEDLYEAIKDVDFEAGTPNLHKNRIAFEPYLTFDYKIVIEGSDGAFHCTYSTMPLDGGDVAFNLVDGAIDALLGVNKRLDRRLSGENEKKYGNLSNAIAILCGDAASKINALGL